MGYRSDQFPVLQHRGTAHSLDNSTGSGEKIIIRDSQDKTFIGISCIAVDLKNLTLIFPDSITDITADLRFSCLNLLFESCRYLFHGFCIFSGFHLPTDTILRIPTYRSDPVFFPVN